jgi:hypothetical protein
MVWYVLYIYINITVIYILYIYVCMDSWNDGRVRSGASQNSLISGFFSWGDVDR